MADGDGVSGSRSRSLWLTNDGFSLLESSHLLEEGDRQYGTFSNENDTRPGGVRIIPAVQDTTLGSIFENFRSEMRVACYYGQAAWCGLITTLISGACLWGKGHDENVVLIGKIMTLASSMIICCCRLKK